jgi:hypothetical protein
VNGATDGREPVVMGGRGSIVDLVHATGRISRNHRTISVRLLNKTTTKTVASAVDLKAAQRGVTHLASK